MPNSNTSPLFNRFRFHTRNAWFNRASFVRGVDHTPFACESSTLMWLLLLIRKYLQSVKMYFKFWPLSQDWVRLQFSGNRQCRDLLGLLALCISAKQDETIFSVGNSKIICDSYWFIKTTQDETVPTKKNVKKASPIIQLPPLQPRQNNHQTKGPRNNNPPERSSALELTWWGTTMNLCLNVWYGKINIVFPFK